MAVLNSIQAFFLILLLYLSLPYNYMQCQIAYGIREYSGFVMGGAIKMGQWPLS